MSFRILHNTAQNENAETQAVESNDVMEGLNLPHKLFEFGQRQMEKVYQMPVFQEKKNGNTENIITKSI